MPSTLGPRWSHIARVVRGEKELHGAALTALKVLLAYTGASLRSSGYNADTLHPKASGWDKAVATHLIPVAGRTFKASFDAAARGTFPADTFATGYLDAAANRLVGVPDEVFALIRSQLSEGRAAQEGIPQLAARVDALLSDEQRWSNRATTIARTEVIAANNLGAKGAASVSAGDLGYTDADVVKEWLATGDDRTRESHADADGMQVLGMDEPFSLAGGDVDVPGDPDGPASETINCRCAVLFHFPGDPDYPSDLDPTPAASAPSSAAQAPAPATLVTDPGPQTPHEHAARTMTPEELVMETNTTKGLPKTVARGELKRRGLHAAAGPDEEETPTGVVVVALPAADDPCRAIGEEDKHCTLLYFGDVPGGENPNDGLTDDFRTALSALVAEYATTIGPFPESVTGVESLGDEGARVWMLNSDDGVTSIHDDLAADETVAPVLAGVEQYPTYTPHVTIGYPADPDEGTEDETAPEPPETDVAPTLDDATETAAAAVESITFDRLALWWAGEQTEWPMTAGVTAAAGDPAPRRMQAEDAAAGDPAPVVDPAEQAIAEAAESDQFYGVAVVEDSQTGDRRVFGPGSLEWANLPMPLGWQVQDAPGHDGSVVCGRIDSFQRFGNLIAYTGTWDTEGAGWETRRLVAGRFLTGLSVDTDDFDAEVVTPDGEVIDPFDAMFGEGEEPILLVNHARIRSSVMCRVPAFTEAFIANGEPPAGWAGERPAGTEEAPAVEAPAPEEAVAAAALVAAAVRADNPPRPAAYTLADFRNPGLTEPTRLTVTDDGRVFGHLATWGTCHIGIDGACVEPPASAVNYAYFATGSVLLDDGSQMPVGQLTMETGHASLGLNHRAAAAHYDNTGSAVADVAMGQDGIGIWFSGRVRQSATEEQVFAMRAAGSVSGDWRDVGGQLELVAALVVNVPGFPIEGPSLAASGKRAVALVASGVVKPQADEPLLLTFADVQRLAIEAIDRRDRAVRAQTRVRTSRVEQATKQLAATAAADRAKRVAKAAAQIERV